MIEQEEAQHTHNTAKTLYSKRQSLLRSIYLRAEIRANPLWPEIELASEAQALVNDRSLSKTDREEFASILKDISTEAIVQSRRYYGLNRSIDELQEQIQRHKETYT